MSHQGQSPNASLGSANNRTGSHHDPRNNANKAGKGKDKEKDFTKSGIADMLLHSPHKPAYDPTKDMAGSYDEDDEKPSYSRSLQFFDNRSQDSSEDDRKTMTTFQRVQSQKSFIQRHREAAKMRMFSKGLSVSQPAQSTQPNIQPNTIEPTSGSEPHKEAEDLSLGNFANEGDNKSLTGADSSATDSEKPLQCAIGPATANDTTGKTQDPQTNPLKNKEAEKIDDKRIKTKISNSRTNKDDEKAIRSKGNNNRLSKNSIDSKDDENDKPCEKGKGNGQERKRGELRKAASHKQVPKASRESSEDRARSNGNGSRLNNPEEKPATLRQPKPIRLSKSDAPTNSEDKKMATNLTHEDTKSSSTHSESPVANARVSKENKDITTSEGIFKTPASLPTLRKGGSRRLPKGKLREGDEAKEKKERVEVQLYSP